METCFKILQLKFDKKLTNRCIGLTLHISASTVFEVLARFKASSLSWPLPADISHDTLEKLIFPPKDTFASELVMPDMLYFDTEMRKTGVTRQLLWMEYKAQAGDKAMGYSHFCRCYREWKKTRRLSMRQEHRAGEKLFIDFCGPTVPVINPDTGEIRRVAIFVAVMGASNYTYVEACEGQDMMSWLNAHSRCLTFLGGVPKLLIPDNLRSAVKKADRYEPVINDSYQALAEHYGTVIIPARPRKPKDKPKAENGVLIVERWLLARIRNETFHTLRALNARLRELLTDMNNRPMKGYCRTGRLLEQLAQGRVDGSWLKYLKQLQKIQVLILDDLGLEQLSNAQCNDLLELIEDRYGQSSTIVVSQFPVDKWHGLMENPTTADAILDRLVHNSHRVVLQGESLRKNPPVVESSEKTR
ncbi:IS21 family transposase [Escherichia coli]|nr:IS21 family transposase [Escherichia coli]